MKKSLKSILVLVSICGVIALLLALTNMVTAPLIEENQKIATEQALKQVMPEGEGFEKIEPEVALPATVTEVYRETGGGYAIKLKTAGFDNDFVILCGVRADGTVSGAVCLSSKETLGVEKDYGERFKNTDAAGAAKVDTVSDATKTTSAYRAAVQDAIEAAKILSEAEGGKTK
ncbi:MAG: FMN-binding protein [Clostridia bacterium]|nr:FMN-binding protein [Clostridia bacterium]